MTDTGTEHSKETERAAEARAEERGDLGAEVPEIEYTSPIAAPDRYSTKSLDRAFNAHLARFTLGVSPWGLASTCFNWWGHLMGAPGKQVQLLEKAVRKTAQLGVYAGQLASDPTAPPRIDPLPHDHRFEHEGWQQWPYNLIYQSFLLSQQWWYNAACDIDGVRDRDERVVSFVSRQMLDMVSPSNFVATNPEVAAATVQEGGANLVRGVQNFFEDWERAVSGKLPVGTEDYLPGRAVAVTPGKVVYRNRLLELIQYEPQTDRVQAEPVLIVPAWIMKYYILDLSPHNSLVKHLVGQGFTVFMISWRNPTAEDRDKGLADYVEAVDEAMGAVGAIVPERRMHAVGYCLGGTLLTAKAAQMARDGDDRLATMTLFATQTDFEEPGELQLFVSESEVSFLENMMWDQGYLDTKQMAGAFQLLRSADLIWSRYVHEYLMGRRQEMFDLMAWNADATRMPFRMHSDYLRHIFLGNELARGQYRMGAEPVTISAIDVPIFCVSTTEDHVAPWRSVYKLHLLSDTEVTFVLTSGGHNAGIISEPGHEGREFLIRKTGPDDGYLSPEAWKGMAERRGGSWWPGLVDWLVQRSSGEAEPPAMGTKSGKYRPLEDAPGSYVFQR
ncbi:poly-beta-hydroxybutyrate polymerase [Roseovarius sp. TE539]|uniref:PHA/PHB synthase family protein n=1 Tax=Roseovarius sp. TE539 TaxID=2249812 RepID=UPI000DDC4200|nr:alpha/beta fold hydrolase [Roseovarius sp. TE539]RBI71533.1 poly-beta-hydroxybutyrate polymerase [Roseovarius sp. TE539]